MHRSESNLKRDPHVPRIIHVDRRDPAVWACWRLR